MPTKLVLGSRVQVDEPPVSGAQRGSSRSSLAPVITFSASVGFTAIGDSFCLFRGYGVPAGVGLTSCSVTVAACTFDAPLSTTASPTAVAPARRLVGRSAVITSEFANGIMFSMASPRLRFFYSDQGRRPDYLSRAIVPRSSELACLCLRLRQPIRHPHLAVHRRRGG